jgi:hypothetical protein
MADAGDLEKLPLELRKQVYAHLFVESKNIAISRYRIGPGKQVARSDNRRDCTHRGEIFDPHQVKRVTAPPGITLLLLVNKVLNQEATETFCGLNGFEFPDSDVLKCFLEVIGNSRQHLHPGRPIALNDEELVCRCVCAAAEDKNKTLAKSLRKKIICCLA